MGTFSETVKSLGISGTAGTQPTIAIGANTLTLADPQGENYSGTFSTTAGGKVIKNGSGNLILTGSSGSFVEGEFILNSGNIAIGSVNMFGTNANNSKLTINGGSLSNNAPATGRTMSTKFVDIGGSFSFDFTGSANVEFLGGSGAALGSTVITLKTNPTIAVTNTEGSTGVLLFRGAIGDEGAGRGFTKAGNGTLVLQHNASTFSGNVTISEGILRVAHQTATNTTGVPPGMLDPSTSAIGNGAGTVFLSGGALSYNGAVQAPNPRSMPVLNPIVLTQDSSISYITTGNQSTDEVTFDFKSNSISGTGGTLTISRDTSNPSTLNTFRPTFSGSGFNFSRPVIMSQESASKTTVLTSTNTTGTQTWSGAISGNAGYERNGAGGTTVFTGANTYSGGTTVTAGTLQASGAAATFGDGNVTVNGGALEILSGVSDAIDNAAMLTLAGGGTPGVADVGYLMLGAGINETVAGLTLVGLGAMPGGTYNSTTHPEYFLGAGNLIVPSAGLPGDYNDDQVVDAADFVMWRKLFNPAGPALPNDDTPGVDNDDYDRWKTHFGETSAGSGGSSATSGQVPEPASAVLVLAVLAVAHAARRRQP
jgi:fibronectin-binding autotransporter adhesin